MEHELKLEDFKTKLRTEIDIICADQKWNPNDNRQRGMAFENWCFDLFSQKHPTADNDIETSIMRTDDGGIDIVFESSDTKEAYVIQAKHPYTKQNKPMPENEVKEFFSNFELLKDDKYIQDRRGKNTRLNDLSNEIKYWIENNWNINFIFVSTYLLGQNIQALVDAYNQKFTNSSFTIKFSAWGIDELKDAYNDIISTGEEYPESITVTLADDHFMFPQGDIENITFVLKGSDLQTIARQHKESLFNWNIRRFLGKKSEVNQGLCKTINESPKNFYYFNNGISALCTDYNFNPNTKNLVIKKMQVVNGAQTLGAIQNSDPNKLKDVFVLVKLTKLKNFLKETGVSAELIRTNNTQNKLALPDFRSNDPIQIWLERKFKETKPRGELRQIDYGRKRPYPRSSQNKLVIKLQELGKIRYAWLHDPRTPIADPAKLFELPSEGGLYGYSFGVNGELEDYWHESHFKETLLAIHTFTKLEASLKNYQSGNEKLKQLHRLKYYALSLFRKYLYQTFKGDLSFELDEMYKFGSKYNSFYEKAERLIAITLTEAYTDMLENRGGTLFSLPRDSSVWDLVQQKFDNTLKIAQLLSTDKTSSA